MPSTLHEALLTLFRNRPTLAAELLAGALDVALPPFAAVRFGAADLGDVAPTEYRADLVLVFDDARARPAFAVVLEAQLAPDPRKRFTWPVYTAAERARLECPTLLLVVTVDPAAAAFARAAIDLGHPGFVLRPVVLGPDVVPYVEDDGEAARAPELAVLSALAHAEGPRGRAVARAAIAAAAHLDEERARLYADLVLSALGAAARAVLEELMQSGKYEYQSEFAKHYIAVGEAQGRAQGEALGLEKGEALGEAKSVLIVLEARGLAIPTDARARIEACTDVPTLDTWLRRAASATTVDEIFD